NQGGKARNFELVAAPCVDPERQYWTPLVPHRDDVKLDAVDAFADYLVLSERADGLDRISVMRTEDGDVHEIRFPEPVYTAGVGSNPEYESRTLRYSYTSLVTPPTDVDYELDTRERVVIKTQPVLGGYDPSQYTTTREWATASDGTRVPISLVRRIDTPVDGTAAALLYGDGSRVCYPDPAVSADRPPRLSPGVSG